MRKISFMRVVGTFLNTFIFMWVGSAFQMQYSITHRVLETLMLICMGIFASDRIALLLEKGE